MSGGSWEYFYHKLDDVASRLQQDHASPIRRAFGDHLAKCSKALHDIEWVDSCDYGKGEELPAIRAVLEDTATEKTAEQIRAEITRLRDGLNELLQQNTVVSQPGQNRPPSPTPRENP